MARFSVANARLGSMAAAPHPMTLSAAGALAVGHYGVDAGHILMTAAPLAMTLEDASIDQPSVAGWNLGIRDH